MQKSKIKMTIQNSKLNPKKLKSYNLQPNRGFTIIELLVVVLIVGLLATAISVNLILGQKKARDRKRMADLQNIAAAIELYRSKNRYYPANNETKNGVYSNNANWIIPGLAPNYIQFLPIDPANNDTYRYKYKTNSNSQAEAYELNGKLEQDTKSMKNDISVLNGGNDNYYEVGGGDWVNNSGAHQWWKIWP